MSSAARVGAFAAARGGIFFGRPIHVILSGHVHYEPDLCFFAGEREVDLEAAFVESAPDLIIEVISESNRSHDTVVKYRDYERHGVREYWLVDPREGLIRVSVLEGGAYRPAGIFGRGERVRSHVLAGLALDPAEVF